MSGDLFIPAALDPIYVRSCVYVDEDRKIKDLKWTPVYARRFEKR